MHVRSLNNLIERLHHSTSLYLLISDRHFVTMNKYTPPLMLLAAPNAFMVGGISVTHLCCRPSRFASTLQGLLELYRTRSPRFLSVFCVLALAAAPGAAIRWLAALAFQAGYSFNAWVCHAPILCGAVGHCAHRLFGFWPRFSCSFVQRPCWLAG